MKPATAFSKFGALILFQFLLFAILFTGGKSQSVECNDNDIAITQGKGSPEFNHIPTYIVEITNQCRTGCSIKDLILKCGQFSSDMLINPNVFMRLTVDNCLVNSGMAIPPGSTISFMYATTYQFPLSVSSFHCFK